MGSKIRFSIGAKLVTIIVIILLISLGSLTVLVSLLVRSDLQVSAVEKNFDMNRRSALAAETFLINIKADSSVLINSITVHGLRPAQASANVIRQSTDFFFAENPKIGAVFFNIQGTNEQLLINRDFFQSREIDQNSAAAFFSEQKDALIRTARSEVLLNAAPHFSHPVLALFFSLNDTGTAGVLFSSENLNHDFGIGENKSWLINSEGGLLVSADFSLLNEGTNLSNLQFVRSILESPDKSGEELIEEDFGLLKLQPVSADNGFLQKAWEKIKSFFKTFDKSSGTSDDTTIDKTRMFTAFSKLNTAGSVVITCIEYEKVFEVVTAATWRNIYLAICVLCLSIIIISLFSRSISVPVKSFANAALQIGEGNFNLGNIDHSSNDEIGLLSDNFIKMSSALDIFGSFSNKDIAVKTMRGEIKPEGFSKPASILFADIRNFEAKAEDFSNYYGAEAPEKFFMWLNNYFSEMAGCVEKTNGTVDKFIGDALMAHWGAASSAGSPRNDAFNCVKAALMMRKSLYFLNKKRRQGDSGNPPIRIGCGINSGIVAAGLIGSASHKEFTVIGDPVNFASRIENMTKTADFDILISEETWKLAGDRFVCEELPAVTMEGRDKPIRLFAVINFAGEPKGPQTLSDVRTLF